MVNPFKSVWDYYEKTGVRRDLPVLKRMMVEIPHVPIGLAISIASMTATYVYMKFFYDDGIGYQLRYSVMRPDDPRLLKFRDDVINAGKKSN